ncbi:S8 family serine peptidase [Deinococcus puniceus]|uniref:Uncharacterized protein n=1 Tax=Deinococcus puniceus TaxID=1182568 RepID=A0A172T8D7_9DEIO|nr:S8 family serine peptidase [Deinococcus puniceus]ANE43289.1 hypothetical protein SU48_05365 [Deinococcus puniceus]
MKHLPLNTALLALSLGLLLTACGGTDSAAPTSNVPPTETPVATTPAFDLKAGQSLAARLGVQSFAQLAPQSLPDLASLQREAGDLTSGEVVVGYTSQAQLSRLAAHLGATVKATLPQLNTALLVLPDALSPQRTARALQISGARYAEVNQRRRLLGDVTNQNVGVQSLATQSLGTQAALQPLADADPLSAKQWWISQIKADQVRGIATGKGIVVGVVDDDFDRQHEDLMAEGKIVTGFDATTLKELTPDMPLTSGSHGSGSAGTIGERLGNGKGGAGVAPDAVLMPVRIFDEKGFAGDFNVAYSIVWAVDHGAQVLNNSWGGGGYGQTLKDAVDYALSKNVVVVASAGNDRRDLHNGLGAFPGVISVGASIGDDLKADFSNVGKRVDLYAPGDQGLTTYINESLPPAQRAQSYGLFNGTSMAAPVVTGASALLLERAKTLGITLTPYQVKKMLVAGGDPMKDPRLPTDKRVNVLTALNNFTAASVPADGGKVVVQVADLVMGSPLTGSDVILTPLGGQNKGLDYLAQTSNGDLEGAEADAKAAPAPAWGSAFFYGIEPGEYEVRVAGPSWAVYGGSRTPLLGKVTVTSGATVTRSYQHEADLFEYGATARNGSPATATNFSAAPAEVLAQGLLLGGTFSNDNYVLPPAPGVPAGTPDTDFHRFVVPAGQTLTVHAIARATGSKASARVTVVDATGTPLAGAQTSAGGLGGLADSTATFKATDATTVYLKYANTSGSEGLGHWYGALVTIK